MTDQVVYYQGSEARIFPWGRMDPGDEFLCNDEYAQNVWGRPDGTELAKQLTADDYWGPFGLKTRDADTKQPPLPDVTPPAGQQFSTAALSADEHRAEQPPGPSWSGEHFAAGFVGADETDVQRLGLETPPADAPSEHKRGGRARSAGAASDEGKDE